jgi:hypothetical protein
MGWLGGGNSILMDIDTPVVLMLPHVPLPVFGS